jgi:PAS domain S-box-containing protein
MAPADPGSQTTGGWAESPDTPTELDASVRIAALKEELRAKEEYLQSINEELETSNEELTSSNEEMQSINEEFQSTNEELETSKEEMQSINEELATVNAELQAKVTDLSRANNDMNNLLAGTGIATVFVDHALRILRYTPTATQIINLIPSDVGRPVGHTVSNLVGYDNLVADTQAVLNTLVPQEVEVQTIKGNWYTMRIQPYVTIDNVIEGAVITFVDISEVKKLQEALGKYEQQRRLTQEITNKQLRDQAEGLASIHEALDSIGLIVCDLEENDARMATFNPGAEKTLGYGPDEVLDKSITLIHPPEFLDIFLDRLKRFRQGETLHSIDMILVRKSGERFPATVSVHPFVSQEGQYRKIVVVFRDISELMCVQDQLKTMNSQLELKVEQRTAELQDSQKQYLHAEKLSAIGKLSASIAHEFNNPLQGILSILKGLKKRAILEEEDKELLNAAISESERIKNLIRDLQEFNRPSSGKKKMVDVHSALDSMLLLQKSDFNSKGISVVRHYAEGLPQILAVPDQIKQVFLNLLSNAMDACPRPGGVITISTRLEDESVAVAIKDNGRGINPEDMERIFQPFYTTKPEVKGTGLGLSVSYGIVQYHQGKIRIDSQPGEGATFTILLPIKTDCDAATAPRTDG